MKDRCFCSAGETGAPHADYCLRMMELQLLRDLSAEQRRTREAIEALGKGLAEGTTAAGSLRKFLGKLGGGG